MHDGIVTSFCLTKSRVFSFEICRVDGSRVSVDIEGIRLLNAAELWETAIISEIFIWKLDKSESHSLNVALSHLLQGRVNESDKQSALSQIRRENFLALTVQVSCSYGGSIFAICDRVRIFEID